MQSLQPFTLPFKLAVRNLLAPFIKFDRCLFTGNLTSVFFLLVSPEDAPQALHQAISLL